MVEKQQSEYHPIFFQDDLQSLSLEEISKYSPDDRIDYFVTEAYRMLDARIISTIAKARDENAVTSDWAGPANAAGLALSGIVFCSTGSPLPGAAPVAAKAAGKIETKREHELCKKLYQFFPKYEDRRADYWRKLFVGVLIETFINYNVVFCSVLGRPSFGVELALHKMAKDLVNRIFEHLDVESKTQIAELNDCLMVKAIVNGKSPKDAMDMLKKSEGGGTIKTKQNVTYKTGSLYSKCDVVFLQENGVGKK